MKYSKPYHRAIFLMYAMIAMSECDGEIDDTVVVTARRAANIMGCSRPTAIDAIDTLLKWGWIDGDQRYAKVYKLNSIGVSAYSKHKGFYDYIANKHVQIMKHNLGVENG